MPGFTLALGILHPCIALAIYLSTCIPLPQQLEASPPPLGNIRHAAGRRSGLSSCGAYRRPPLRSGLSVIPTTIALLYALALKLAKLIGATVLRCCQGRTRAPHTVRQSPMTAPPPCGTGQTTDQRGAAALWPARYYGHEEFTLNARFGVFGVNFIFSACQGSHAKSSSLGF